MDKSTQQTVIAALRHRMRDAVTRLAVCKQAQRHQCHPLERYPRLHLFAQFCPGQRWRGIEPVNMGTHAGHAIGGSPGHCLSGTLLQIFGVPVLAILMQGFNRGQQTRL